MKMKTVNLVELLYDTLQETINNGLEDDEVAKNTFQEKDLQELELENTYRLYGNLFGLNYISNIINKLNKLNKEAESEGE